MPSLFDRGVFTLSFDFELVWGSRDLVTEPAPLLAMARRTRDEVFPALLELLQRYGIVATWATVGHLFLDRAEPEAGVLHPDLVLPRHAWRSAPWFDGVPAGTEAEHPAFYGRSLVLRLREAGQEIGSHSFSHPIFGDEGCSREVADSDLRRCVAEADALGIKLRSFVFPRNIPGHVDLLRAHGFAAWRGVEPAWYQRDGLPGPARRLLHLADVLRAARPPVVQPFLDAHGLWCIPASATFLPIDGVRRLIPMSRRLRRCRRGLEAAAAQRGLFHLYTHPINLATDPPAMLSAFEQVFADAARLRDKGALDILSMGQIVDRLRIQGAEAPSARSSAR